MKPIIAIVGRPNVGKSTLFNALTKTRAALVVDFPGVTRDRLWGDGTTGDRPFSIIDTGGIGMVAKDLDLVTVEQTQMAIEEADALIFLLDARDGLTHVDRTLAEEFRRLGKPIVVAVNKTDGLDENVVMGDFYTLCLQGQSPVPIAAAHQRGLLSLMESVWEVLPKDVEWDEFEEEIDPYASIRVAVVGRPNVGKSTLVNRMLGEDRVAVYDQAGTTRDSIYIPFEKGGQKYTLIDTAGIRRRKNSNDLIEKFSIVKALEAIDKAHVVLFVVNAHEGISEQDRRLLGMVLYAGRSVVFVINKWDHTTDDMKREVEEALKFELTFADFAENFKISALHGTGVGDLFAAIKRAYVSATKQLSTTLLTSMLEKIIETHTPPIVHGRRIKLRYAHCGGHNPPIIVIHGNQTDAVPLTYKRYLMNAYRKLLKMVGTPILIEFKSSKNPYADKKNLLTPRQMHRRKKMMDRNKK